MLIGGYYLLQLSVNEHKKTEGNAKLAFPSVFLCNILA